jgi:hypothetical protein
MPAPVVGEALAGDVVQPAEGEGAKPESRRSRNRGRTAAERFAIRQAERQARAGQASPGAESAGADDGVTIATVSQPEVTAVAEVAMAPAAAPVAEALQELVTEAMARQVQRKRRHRRRRKWYQAACAQGQAAISRRADSRARPSLKRLESRSDAPAVQPEAPAAAKPKAPAAVQQDVPAAAKEAAGAASNAARSSVMAAPRKVRATKPSLQPSRLLPQRR